MKDSPTESKSAQASPQNTFEFVTPCYSSSDLPVFFPMFMFTISASLKIDNYFFKLARKRLTDTAFHGTGRGLKIFQSSRIDYIGVQTSLGEQLLDVPVRQGKTQIPTNRQKDDFRFQLPPLEQTANR